MTMLAVLLPESSFCGSIALLPFWCLDAKGEKCSSRIDACVLCVFPFIALFMSYSLC